MDVAVLGTGIMGVGATHSLLREGHAVRVWNRTPERAQALVTDGAVVAETAPEAVAGADVVLTFVFDADAVLDVLRDVAESIGDAVVLQASTIGVDGARRVAELAAESGLTLVDAPALGTKQPAEQGTLVMLVSGDSAAIERARPVLDAIGTKTVHAGEQIGQASALKLAVNAWVGTLSAGLAQSIALAEGLGLDPTLFLDALVGGATDTPYAHVKGAAMIEHEYPTSFSVDGVVKDVGLMRAAAHQAGVTDELLVAIEGLFKRTSDSGRGGEDMAAVRETF